MTTVPVLQQVKEAVARGVAELRMSPEALVELFEQLANEPDNAAAEDGAKHPRRGEPGFVGTYNNVPVFVFGRPEAAAFVSANEQLAAALDERTRERDAARGEALAEAAARKEEGALLEALARAVGRFYAQVAWADPPTTDAGVAEGLRVRLSVEECAALIEAMDSVGSVPTNATPAEWRRSRAEADRG